jgi:NADH-ubiquinone oxidoreductase chain 5
VLYLGGQTTKVLDKGSIEYIGPFGLQKGLTLMSKNITLLNNSVVTNYALYILVGILTYLLVIFSYGLNIDLLLLLTIFSLFTINTSK